MILNHKKALDYILENRKDFKNLNLRKIEDVHGFWLEGSGVAKGLSKKSCRYYWDKIQTVGQ